MMMNPSEPGPIDLYEFLTESELQHYYNSIKNELKITNASQFKYATDEDLKQIGLSRPEIRRLRKFYEKYYPHGYFSKIKRLLQAPTIIVKRDDGNPPIAHNYTQSSDSQTSTRTGNSPNRVPNNKHIIPADAICVNKQLGTGEFGIVQQGVWTNGTERIQVAIKCLCRERMQSNPMEFLKEAAIMHSIEHENIVRLYGVVLATDSLMLVTELAHLRSLLECLKDSGLRVSFLTIPTLCEFAMQICNGMKYLENKRLIHRDLAARNILVFSKNKVKISDFGLSRALGVGKDYYKTNFNINLKLPIAWCAPECINYLRFTNASDVWAYGVCLWEMFSYGFQPWAALTGLQILEAIDAPNYQRLEQPECCPREYYHLMMKCWQDDPLKRPKFHEIYELLPEMKPEQLKTVINCCEPKKDQLMYRQGEIITVLDRNTGTPFWKGVLISGKTGLFNPANTVAFLEGLPSSNRDSFCRSNERCSKRKLRTEMISMPQNDFKHTGHIGIDGDSFGDVAFLGNSQSYNHVPRQIVTPYKPSEDIEQTPLLLPPTPTSPDSLQTASGYFPEETATSSTNPTFVSSNENTPKQHNTLGGPSSFDFSSHTKSMMQTSTNPFATTNLQSIENCDDTNGSFALQNNNYSTDSNAFTNTNLENDTLPSDNHIQSNSVSIKQRTSLNSGISGWPSSNSGGNNIEDQHEYHEISDDEMTSDKFDFGPSLLDEINSMFGSMNTAAGAAMIDCHSKSPEFEHRNRENQFTELSSKLSRKNSGDSNGNKTTSSSSSSKKKSSGTVKPISVKDEKILNHAIEIANEISARSMTDLVSDQAPTTQSPKRKFSFRFPHLSNHGAHEKGSSSSGTNSVGSSASGHNIGATASYSKDKKKFIEELKSIPDLQSTITEEGREAYNSLIERKLTSTFISKLDTNEFDMTTAKTLPRRSMHVRNENDVMIQRSGTLGSEHNAARTQNRRQNQNHPLTIPLQDAPRPMTLPTRSSSSSSKARKSCIDEISKSGRMQCDSKQLPDDGDGGGNHHDNIENIADNGASHGGGSDKESLCESPSYLTNTFYTFPEKQKFLSTANEINISQVDNAANPIPLPPRDRNKVIKTNPKRHVRKYPLIIPAYGVQRTLNKVTEITPVDDEPKVPFPGTTNKREDQQIAMQLGQNQNNSDRKSSNLRKITHEVVAAVRPTSRHSATYENTSPAYQNVHNLQKNCMNESSTDSASLQFESILEDDFNKIDVLQSPDVTDGFYNFSIHKEHYKSKEVNFDAKKISGLYVNEDELRNLDIEKKVTVPFIASSPTTEASTNTNNCMPTSFNEIKEKKLIGNELAGHALFNKIRDTVNTVTNSTLKNEKDAAVSSTSEISEVNDKPIQNLRLKDSNSVSCEDLLEFSDRKPKGCERGVDSDEVRIMMKVLGKDSTPIRCLNVLEFIDWDVHKAIKLIKLQNILNTIDLSLSESVESLQKYEWDLQITAMKLKGLK